LPAPCLQFMQGQSGKTGRILGDEGSLCFHGQTVPTVWQGGGAEMGRVRQVRGGVEMQSRFSDAGRAQNQTRTHCHDNRE
jgi:hypothetical protein